MEKIINKKLGMLFGVLSLLIMITTFINAFGVATPYWDGYPLKLAPGESMIVNLDLQNMVGNENVTLRANLTNNGGGIANLTDKNLDYFIPLGKELNVPIKIEIPKDAKMSGIYQIALTFIQVSSKKGGMVRVTGGVTTKFPVKIVNPKESKLYKATPPKNKISLVNSLTILII